MCNTPAFRHVARDQIECRARSKRRAIYASKSPARRSGAWIGAGSTIVLALAAALAPTPAFAQYACGLSFARSVTCTGDDFERDCFARLLHKDTPAAHHRVRRDPDNDGYGYKSYRLVMLGPKVDVAIHVSENAGALSARETWTQDKVAREWGKVYAQMPDFVHHMMPRGVALGAVLDFGGSTADEGKTLGRYCDNRGVACNGPADLPDGLADHVIYMASSMLFDGSCYDGNSTWYNAGREQIREELMLHEIAHLFGATLAWDDDWSDHGEYVTWAAEWNAKWGDTREHYAESFMAWAIYYYPRASFPRCTGRVPAMPCEGT